MTNKLISAVAIFTFIVGCNNATELDNSVEKHEEKTLSSVEENNYESKESNLTIKTSDQLLLGEVTPKKSQTISINDTKFKLVGDKFAQGEQVYNTVMNEYGTIKGSLVLVLSDKGVFNKSHFKKVNKIADKTYRVWPAEKDDFHFFYQKLTNNSNFSVVELEVDYTPISKRQTY